MARLHRRGRHARAAAHPPAADPAARRARALPRDPRPVARVPRPRAGDARAPPRRRGGDDGRRARRLPRAPLVAEARRDARRGGDPGRVRDLGRPLHLPVRRHPGAAGVDRDARDRALDRAADEHGQLPRRDGRARRRRLRDLGHDLRRDRALAGQAGRGRRGRDRRGRVLRLPAPQLLSGADLHGRLGRAPARVRARHGGGPGAAEDRRDRRAVLPAARPRRAHPRHVLRGRCGGSSTASRSTRRTRRTSTTASCGAASRSGARR